MNLIGNRMVVSFNQLHNKVMGVGLNGIEIIRPDKWLNHDAMEEEGTVSRFDENTNYLETNPQICTVIHPNANLKYKAGDELFLNYMAWEWAENTEYGYIIDTDFIMFQIMPDKTLQPIKDLYLGEAIYSDEEKTASGIILLGGKKDNLKVKITHVPMDCRLVCEVGDTVVSVDKNNYEFDYWGVKYIKLMRDEIAGICINQE